MSALINVYDPTMWAQETLMQLFPKLKMAGLVYRDFENTVATKGSTVTTRMPNKFTAVDVDPDNFSSVKPTADNLNITLDQWKQVVFEIGDKEATFSLKDLITEFMDPAAEALGGAIEDSLMTMALDVPNYTGVAGTTPATVAAIGTDVQQKFNELNIPDSDRLVVLGPAAVNKFNQLFYLDSTSGSAQQQTDGQLRQKFGMSYTDSTKLPRHITGMAGTTLCNGAQTGTLDTKGSIVGGTISVKGLSANAKKGDIFVIAHGGSIGDVAYVVTADTAHSAGVAPLPVFPALQANVTDGQAVTVIATHSINLAFHKHAFAMVSRPMKTPNAPGASVSVANFGGIGIRSTVWYEPKDIRTYVRIDALWGRKTLDPRKAIRVLG